jgi:threonine/homoserine/homoserine lactone efflux protein
MATDRLLTFSLVAFVLIVVPGPSVLFVVSRALAYGRRTALVTVLGGAMGSVVMAAAVAAGLGALIQASALVYHLLKIVGAAYLIYLGVRAIRHRRALRAAFHAGATEVSSGRTWWEGFVVSVTNPKTGVFFAAILPQFVDVSAGHPALQILLLGAIFTVIALGSDAVWGIGASAVRSWFGRSQRRLDLMGGFGGLTMIGLGVGLAFSGRKD